MNRAVTAGVEEIHRAFPDSLKQKMVPLRTEEGEGESQARRRSLESISGKGNRNSIGLGSKFTGESTQK